MRGLSKIICDSTLGGKRPKKRNAGTINIDLAVPYKEEMCSISKYSGDI